MIPITDRPLNWIWNISLIASMTPFTSPMMEFAICRTKRVMGLSSSVHAAYDRDRPAASTARPRPTPAPLRHSRTPRTINAPLRIPVMTDTTFLMELTTKSQFRVATAPRLNAPAAIRPRPRGRATPLRARIAPTAKRAPPTTVVIMLIFC